MGNTIIGALNSVIDSRGRTNLLPPQVKRNLDGVLQPGKNMVPGLLSWIVSSMPIVAAYHVVPRDQVIDSSQHYRFGFYQARRLLKASGGLRFMPHGADPETLALFTAAHDLGRMMIGSGASRIMYDKESDLLHTVIGAMMFREAFGEQALDPLLSAIIATAERHTLSVGMSADVIKNLGVGQINVPAYKGYSGNLYLADAGISEEWGRYAHLVALADLINCVSVKGLPGVIGYDSLADVRRMDTDELIHYIMNGPGTGDFKVVIKEGTAPVEVSREWTGGIPITADNFSAVLALMMKNAAKFIKPNDPLYLDYLKAFQKGVEVALGWQSTDDGNSWFPMRAGR